MEVWFPPPLGVRLLARQVKCCITGEYGLSDVFIKVGNKYYKSQEVYDNDRKDKDLWNEIVRYICEDLLGYQTGQVFPSLIPRKLAEYKFYNREVILKTFQLKSSDILYQINQDGKFDNEQSKIFYMFAIVKNSINDVYKQWKRDNKQAINKDKEDYIGTNDIENLGTSKSGKDLSTWLEDDEL